MIVVTGAYGFIGSCLVSALNKAGFREIIVVDDFYKDHKERNLEGKWIGEWVHRDIFLPWFKKANRSVDFVFHLGARTDTVDKSWDIFETLNLEYSKELWKVCTEKEIPFIYASSAATYGNGDHGYSDAMDDISILEPLNQYAVSKQKFDLWALEQTEAPPKWAGLKFFNVYGPNEYHKERMASVPFHGYNQVSEKGSMQLFRSHKDGIADGEQQRDFIYVKDVLDICIHFIGAEFDNGFYNVGTGSARTFKSLAEALFSAMEIKTNIEWIDTPESIRENYQYFTEADINKLRQTGYEKEFTSLEEGIKDYVSNYLSGHKYY